MPPPTSLNNIRLQFLKRNAGVGNILRNEKTLILLNKQGSISHY
jgi:hypothetical protein